MSNLLTIRAAIYAHLEEKPYDFDARGQLADLYEDYSNSFIDGVSCKVLAAGQRWQIDNSKYARRSQFSNIDEPCWDISRDNFLDGRKSFVVSWQIFMRMSRSVIIEDEQHANWYREYAIGDMCTADLDIAEALYER